MKQTTIFCLLIFAGLMLRVEWRYDRSGIYSDEKLARGNIISADGMLYIYSDKGEIALVKPNPEKFETVSQSPITVGTEQHWAHPVIFKGVMYVRHEDSLLVYKIK